MGRGALPWIGKRVAARVGTVVLAGAILSASGLAAPPEKFSVCLTCHGGEGTSDNETVPSLGAQREPYTLIQLFMYREGMRVADPINEIGRAHV